MNIILLERIEKLGTIGDVVTVKDGYARNFLLPNKKALRANDANRKVFEANRSRIESDNASKRGEAETHSAKVDGMQVILIRASSNSGQLYGSVSVRDIVDALNAEGAEIAKTTVVLERPIKTIGVFDVRVTLHPEVTVMVKVNFRRKASMSCRRCSTPKSAASPRSTIPTPNRAKSPQTCWKTHRKKALPKPKLWSDYGNERALGNRRPFCWRVVSKASGGDRQTRPAMLERALNAPKIGSHSRIVMLAIKPSTANGSVAMIASSAA